MSTTPPPSRFRTLPRTRLGWWGFGMLAAGAGLNVVQSGLTWATTAWGIDESVRVPDAAFVIVMTAGVVLSLLAVTLRRDYSIMMIALAAVTLISLGGVAIRTFSG